MEGLGRGGKMFDTNVLDKVVDFVGEGAEEIVLSISYKRCSCAESSIGGDTGALGASQYGAAVSW